MLTNAEARTLARIVRSASTEYELNSRQEEELAHLVGEYGLDRVTEWARAQAVIFAPTNDDVDDALEAVFTYSM